MTDNDVIKNPPNLSRPTSLTNDSTSTDKQFIMITQQKLGALITKPNLKADLLQRPPFRFLQDIVREVHAVTGCLGDTFQPEELTKKLEKDEKTAFLEKLVAFVSTKGGSGLKINIKKVLAGQDPERTNDLLQLYADIASQCLTKNSEIAPIQVPESAPRPVDTKMDSKSVATYKQPSPKEMQTDQERISEPGSDRRPNNRLASDIKLEPQTTGLPNTGPAQQESKPSNRPPSSNQHLTDASSAPVLSRPNSIPNDTATSDMSFVMITQQKLGAIITKPTLKADLLQRPPFRFLQDIVREVHTATGCLEDTFQHDELTKKLEKDEKTDFLEKLVAFVSTRSGLGLKINIKKVLAGQDAERTNELLQLLADIARQHAPRNTEVTSLPPPAQSTSNPVQRTIPVNSSTYPEPSLKQIQTDQGKSSKTEFGTKPKELLVPDSKSMPKMADLPNSIQPPYQVEASKQSYASPSLDEQTSVAGSAPPKIQELAKIDTKVASTSLPSGIILEGEEAKHYIEDEEEEDEDINARADFASTPGIVDDDKKHGRLVRDILKQQEKSAPTNDINEGQSSVLERSTGIKLGRIGGKERRSSYSQQMIDQLRENIQKVCQSVNPLGKCIDFVDEDLDLMRLELEKWRQEQVVQKAKLEKEQKISSESLLPLETDLQKIEKQIADTRIRIQKLRGNIIRNDDQLKLLLERQIKA